MRFLHGLLAEKAVHRWVTRLDHWVHFHRFELRIVCDVHDYLSGVPWKSLRERSPHAIAQSYRNHPSSTERSSEAVSG